MKKFIIAGAVALSLTGTIVSLPAQAGAQSYYPSYTSGSCTTISQYLSIGSRGAQVSTLQRFLVAQNYPGGGSWMVTGYFGQATAAAVRDFQQSQGIPVTGSVDGVTQDAINRVSCGLPAQAGGSSSVYPTSPSYPTYPTFPTYPTTPIYPTQPTYSTYPIAPISPTYPSYPFNTYTTPTITSLSQNTGTPGNIVTIYGQGFDLWNNTVNFGGTQLPGIASQNGTSLSFTVPYTLTYSYGSNTSIQLTVNNSRGTSNAVTFTLNPFGCTGYNCGGCGSYPYSYGNNCGGCNSYNSGYNTGYNCGNCGSYYNCNSAPLTITYLSPQQGGVGTDVVVYGTGFSTTGNTVHFGNGIITNLGSADGRSVSFTVPSDLTGFGSQPVVVGTYNVSVSNNTGATSNTVPFTVTSTNSTSGTPTIVSVSGPSTLQTSVTGSWVVTINNPNAAYTTLSVTWGDTGNGYVNQAAPQQIYGSGTQTATFSHAFITAGTYTITFTASNQNGTSNSYTTSVVVSGSSTYNGVPSISYLSPNSGRVGTQVTIYGSNFASSGNVINFGSGVITNAISNGSSLVFTIPSSVGPYCQSGYACPQYLIQITPGTYNVSVMDQYGTSNTLSFTVFQ